jgi:hypothetical protein
VKRTTVIACAVAALASGVALASGAPQTFSFTSVTVSMKQTKKGFSAVSNDLVGRKKVGQDRLNCVFKKNTGHCTVTFIRTPGTIKSTFTLKGNQNRGTMKIVGGTGTYEGTTGSGSFKNLDPQGKRTAITLKLS